MAKRYRSAEQLRVSWEVFLEDVVAFRGDRLPPTKFKLLSKIVSEPGLQFVLLGRLQMWAESGRLSVLARALHLLNLRLTGGEWGHGCQVGGGLVVKHPLGVVLGGGSRIGNSCTILGKVTLGERDPRIERPLYPTLGDRVTVGTGASVLGDVTLGDGVLVGAHAVVLIDVEEGHMAVGVPARLKRFEDHPRS